MIWNGGDDPPNDANAARAGGTRRDAQPQAFFARVAQGYADRAAADPQRFLRIAADQPREAVWEAVRAGVQARGLLP